MLVENRGNAVHRAFRSADGLALAFRVRHAAFYSGADDRKLQFRKHRAHLHERL